MQQLGHLQRDGQPFTALLAVGMGFDAWAEIGGAQAQQAAAYGTQRQVGDGVGRPIGVRGGGEQGGTIERVARHAAFPQRQQFGGAQNAHDKHSAITRVP